VSPICTPQSLGRHNRSGSAKASLLPSATLSRRRIGASAACRKTKADLVTGAGSSPWRSPRWNKDDGKLHRNRDAV